MSVSLVINGQTYFYPETRDVGWGTEATDWASAVTVGMLQKAGGLFQLLAEVDFGTAYGIKSLYLKSRTANVAAAGQIRLAVSDTISFRNNANNADLPLGVDGSNNLTFNSVALTTSSLTSGYIFVGNASNIATGVAMSGDIAITNAGVTSIGSGKIVNAQVNASAAIDFSKLAALTSGNIIVGSAGNVATSVAMSGDITITNAGVTAIGSGKIVNAQVNASAAIDY